MTIDDRRQLRGLRVLLASMTCLLAVAVAIPASGQSEGVPSPAASLAADPSPSPTSTASAASATLLVYSGVPDPTWPLTPADLEGLATIVSQLAPTEGLPPEGGLGYRGFGVTTPEGTWLVNGGVVLAPGSVPGTALADPERTVERYLLATGSEILTDEVVHVVTEALEAAPDPDA